MGLTEVLTIGLSVVPEELTPRGQTLSPAVGIALFAAFILIALSKLVKSDVFENLLLSNAKISGLQTYLRESFPLFRGGSFLLLFNYLLSFGLVLYMMNGFASMHMDYQWWTALLVPAVLLLWPLGSMFAVGLLTGERQVFADPIAMKMVGSEMLGLVYFVLALVLALYAFDEILFIEIVIGAFAIESSLRIVKSIASAVASGVSWYYIILYFCTLEILPLFVAYYVLLRDFIQS